MPDGSRKTITWITHWNSAARRANSQKWFDFPFKTLTRNQQSKVALMNALSCLEVYTAAAVNRKKSKCETLGIRFIDEIRTLPENGTIKEIDIISLMGNLIDNAIEACAACMPEEQHACNESLPPVENCPCDEDCPHEEKQPADNNDGAPFIRVESAIRKKIWCFTVVNSKNLAIRLKEGRMPTTKHDTRNHGLGIGIVKSIVYRYNGALKMDDLGSTFAVDARLFTRKISSKRK